MDNNHKIKRITNSKMKIKIGLTTIIISLMIGCSEVKVPQDNFYVNSGGFGELRVPLIKPFYMFCYERDNWMVVEDGYNGYKSNCGSMYEVKRLKAFDDLFLFRSYGGLDNFFTNGESHPEWWFIIDVENKIKECYFDYKAFSDTLYARYQITTDTLSWRTPRSYSDEFRKERFLPWFPDSITNNTKIRKKYLSEWLKGI